MRHWILVALSLTITACSNTEIKDNLGLNRSGPDEFQVLARPPLNVPPEFHLRPPTQGAEYSPAVPATDRAQQSILGTRNTTALPLADTAVPIVTTDSAASSAEAQFLKNAGADAANPSIRSQIYNDIENNTAPKDSNYLLQVTGKAKDTVVDPKKEAARIKTNKATNKPITEGNTPTIKPSSGKGILGEIF